MAHDTDVRQHSIFCSKQKFCNYISILYLARTMPATPIAFIQNHVKACLRCGESFACLANEEKACDCFTVQLSDETREHIAQLGYTDCLCNNCLLRLEDEVSHSLHSEAHA